MVVPIRNCQALLLRHLDSLVRCAQRVEQIVVVDSNSTDGSLELLQKHLNHSNLHFLNVVPGMYQAWNAGIRLCAARYSYVATAGDAIEPDGLRHLLEVVDQFEADAVLSPPIFVSEEGRRFLRKEWSLHQYLAHRCITSPEEIPRSHVFVSSAVHGLAGFMGSSASNLYRTEVLQKSPFPTEFGHVGDTAWGLTSSLSLCMALTPRRCAEHVLHAPANGTTEAEARETEQRLLELARTILAEAIAAGGLPADAGDLNGFLDDLAGHWQFQAEAVRDYDQVRERKWPWLLSPAGLTARLARDRQRRRSFRFWEEALRRFDF